MRARQPHRQKEISRDSPTRGRHITKIRMAVSDRPSSRRAEARDPATLPERLRELARRGCAREVAANPNAPSDLLLKLAGRHFEAFSSNPILPLLLLEDPGFCLRIPANSLRRLLRRSHLPEIFLRALERHPHPEVRDNARWHVALPSPVDPAAELADRLRGLPVRRGMLEPLLALQAIPLWLLEPLGGAADPQLRHLVLRRLKGDSQPDAQALWRLLERGGLRPPAPDTWTGPAPDLTPAELDRLASGGTAARYQAALHPVTPSVALRRLANDENLKVRLAAFVNPAMAAETLWAFASSTDERIREKIARNAATPPQLLDQLAHDKSVKVRRRVAGHRCVWDTTLARLAADADREVVTLVVRHPRCGVATLEVLSHSTEVQVRVAVAENRCTPLAVSERLAADSSASVRKALAEKGNVTRDILIALCCDADDGVSSDARFRRNLPLSVKRAFYKLPKSCPELAEVLRDWTPPPPRHPPAPPGPPSVCVPKRKYWQKHLTEEEWRRSHRAMKQNVPPEEMAELAADPEPKVRENVAWNSHSPEELLRQLAGDPVVGVRRKLAFNQGCPPDALARLADDTDFEVRRRVCWRSELPAAAILRLAVDPDPEIQRRLAANPSAPASLHSEWAHSPDPEIRAGLARNPGALPELLRGLVADDSIKIRRAVAANPATPAAALEVLSSDNSSEVRASLGGNPNLPASLAAQLARDSESAVREAVAVHPALDLEQARVLLVDSAPAVRRAVAARRDLDSAIYRNLATNGTAGMAKVLAHNPAAPGDVLKMLSLHSEAEVRLAVVSNPSAPLDLLLKLVEQPNLAAHIIHRKDKPPELIEKLLSLSGGTKVHSLLQDPNTPIEVYEHFVREGSVEDQKALCHNDATPLPILEMLARHQSPEITRSLAWRDRLPAAIVGILIETAEPWTRYQLIERHRLPAEPLAKVIADETVPDYLRRRIRIAAAKRRDTPIHLLEEMVRSEVSRAQQHPARRRRRRYRNLGNDEEVLAALAVRTELDVGFFEPVLDTHEPALQLALLARADLPPDWRLRILDSALSSALSGTSPIARLAALAHERLPADRLASFAQNGSWLERYAVTQNGAAERSLLEALAQDANVIVRTAAATRLASSAQ